MKYHSILTPAFISLCLLTSNSSLATESTTQSSDEQARWFEIEIILFKHLSSKSANSSEKTEHFSPTDLNAKKRRSFDLLAPYLQPNIASLKQLLPNCEQPATSLPYNITPATLWAESVKSESNEVDSADTGAASLPSKRERGQNINQPRAKENKPSTNMSVTVLSAISNEVDKESVDTSVDKNVSELSDQAQYKTNEPSIELPVYSQYPTSSKTPLCVIPAEFFQQQLTSEQFSNFKIDGFPVDKLTKTIDGLEQWQDDDTGEITWASNTPYLISKNSLRLSAIANRIKRSRNYAPLLHFGWRQVGESRRQAKAIKLYAGEHLDLRYQQAIAEQESEQQSLKIQAILEQRQKTEALVHSQSNVLDHETQNVGENPINNTASNNESLITPSQPLALAIENTELVNELSIAEQLRLQAKQQQLDTLFQQFALLTNQIDIQNDNPESNDEEATKRIIAQLSADINVKEMQLSVNNPIDKSIAITPPLQPWSIDGIFKVHLDHYLYINTELNIIDSSHKPSVLTATQKPINKGNKNVSQRGLISFKQNRRVITGEIHYFDHPNIGMVVQIRRFDPTKPADEAVSQSKK